MIFLDNQTSFTYESEKLQIILDTLTDRDMELLFVDDENIKELNFIHRGKNTPTDVLSFPLVQMPHLPLGTVVISMETAKRVSEKLGHSIDDEVALLFIHGLLHLLGYDHEKDGGEMREEERKLIKLFGLPESLIVRTKSQ